LAFVAGSRYHLLSTYFLLINSSTNESLYNIFCNGIRASSCGVHLPNQIEWAWALPPVVWRVWSSWGVKIEAERDLTRKLVYRKWLKMDYGKSLFVFGGSGLMRGFRWLWRCVITYLKLRKNPLQREQTKVAVLSMTIMNVEIIIQRYIHGIAGSKLTVPQIDKCRRLGWAVEASLWQAGEGKVLSTSTIGPSYAFTLFSSIFNNCCKMTPLLSFSRNGVLTVCDPSIAMSYHWGDGRDWNCD
jgi:hypothetical protein